MRSLLRLVDLARRHVAWIGVAALSMVLVAGATVFAYNLIRPIYDEVLRPEQAAAAVSQTGLASLLSPRGLVGRLDRLAAAARQHLSPHAGERTSLLLLVLIAVVVKNGGTFCSRYAIARLGLATIRDLRLRLYDALLRQSPEFFQGTSSGQLISRMVNDVQLIREALSERFGDLLQDSLTVVVLLAYVLSLETRLALATLVLAPVLLAPVLSLSRRLRLRSRQAQQQMGEATTLLDETVKGMRVVQAFGRERFEQERFRSVTRRHLQASLRARAIQAANAPAMEIIGTVAFVALISYTSAQIARGSMTVGDLSAFLLGIYGAYNPIKRLNKFNLALQQAVVAAERVFAVIDAPVSISDRRGAVELDTIGDGVHLESVTFSYDRLRPVAGVPVLDRLDLHLPAGTTVALVGASGSGKSTVAQLIARFWDVQAGSVRIGALDVRDVTLRSLRARLGLVTQETNLFNDTVRSNIAYGREDADRQQIEAAATAALAHEFIIRLPDGYETVIGEGGVKLSGGQRQRLAIARALLKDPPILILDEATSALDAEAEQLVQRALENLMRGRTTLLIAHRLSTVQHADEIVVLQGGRVVEQGTHAELLAAGGEYCRLIAAEPGGEQQGSAGKESPGE